MTEERTTVGDAGQGRRTTRGRGTTDPGGTTRRTFVRTTGAVALGTGLGAGATVTGTAAGGEMNAVAFDFSNLPALSNGAHYEGWAIFGADDKVSTGTFSAGDEYVFEVDRDLSMAKKLAVTIEPEGDDDATPSGVVILKGTVMDGEAQLSFPTSFDDIAGSYILATPTNGGESDETSGIWFLDPTGDGPSASLDLPDLPSGWTYEGWVVHEGTPVTTGRFDDPAAADASAPYSGDQGAPPFPGEDFLTSAPGELSFPTDLTDGSSKAVITVEPDLDGTDPTGDGPFPVKPLVGDIPADGTDHTNYDLTAPDEVTPSGTATLYEDREAATGGDEEPAHEAVAFDLTNLLALGDGAHYEGWAIFGADDKVSTGTFSTGDEYVFSADRDLSTADALAITIEPAGDSDAGPSGVVVLKGAVTDGEAELSFPASFHGAAGSYILATPTDGGDSHETSGIWFLDPSGDGPSASLTLPDLPSGWTYEGWVVHEGTPVSTGRFDDPAMADGAAPYSGDQGGPPFPGEDLLMDAPGDLSFPTDLTDGASEAVISVEPALDGTDPTGDGPFQIKPLAGRIPGDGTDHENYSLGRTTGTLPSGSATTYEDVETARADRGELTAVAFDFSMLPELSEGHYEGWAVFGDEKVSTGTFSRGDRYVFDVGRDLTAADALVVTIEPDDDGDAAPSGVVVLKGEVGGRTTRLRFPRQLDAVSGSYILATPTDGGDSHETSGVWFLDPSGDGPSASLDLPELPSGWTYEGWVVHEGTPVSTGRFDDPAMADDAAPYSGDQGGPPFPGEDLLMDAPGNLSFPTDLTGGSSEVVISVEPDVDGTDPTGDGPFQVKPLAAPIPADGTDHESYDLRPRDPMLPSGTATLHDAAMMDAETVGVDLASDVVVDDGTVEAALTLSNAPAGVAGFDLQVTVDDPSVATIAGYEHGAAFDLNSESLISGGGSYLRLKGADTDESTMGGASDLELATLTIQAEELGQTEVRVEVTQIDDHEGGSVATTTTHGLLTVSELPPIDGMVPRDTDDDGIHEDLNANGRFDSDDVVVYFENVDTPAMRDYPGAYDINGNQRVDYDDIVKLFEML